MVRALVRDRNAVNLCTRRIDGADPRRFGALMAGSATGTDGRHVWEVRYRELSKLDLREQELASLWHDFELARKVRLALR